MAERTETAKGRSEVLEPSKQQQAFARRVAESKATIPHLLLRTAIKVDAELTERARPEEMAVRACALALREHPRVNASYRDGEIKLHSRVNVGIAVATDDAPMVPTIFDADRKDLGEIAAEREELVARAKDGSLTAPELAGGTFTVSDLGAYGITDFDPVIVPPQAANLAVGAVGAERTMTATLACDHRVLDGAGAAAFLARVRELVEEPASL